MLLLPLHFFSSDQLRKERKICILRKSNFVYKNTTLLDMDNVYLTVKILCADFRTIFRFITWLRSCMPSWKQLMFHLHTIHQCIVNTLPVTHKSLHLWNLFQLGNDFRKIFFECEPKNDESFQFSFPSKLNYKSQRIIVFFSHNSRTMTNVINRVRDHRIVLGCRPLWKVINEWINFK